MIFFGAWPNWTGLNKLGIQMIVYTYAVCMGIHLYAFFKLYIQCNDYAPKFSLFNQQIRPGPVKFTSHTFDLESLILHCPKKNGHILWLSNKLIRKIILCSWNRERVFNISHLLCCTYPAVQSQATLTCFCTHNLEEWSKAGSNEGPSKCLQSLLDL